MIRRRRSIAILLLAGFLQAGGFSLASPLPGPELAEPEHLPSGGDSKDWWSLRPIRVPSVPTLDPEDRNWARNEIDAFVAAKLRENAMEPSAHAEPHILIRRLYFDLIGLPPTPQEVVAFSANPSDQAYEQVVDQLLASPRYGERWARHWMDAVHFAETHGHDQDRIRTNAWPYRDYLIDAFNSDKSYQRFVKEQLAADVFFPNEPQLTPALGFIAAGPWDESSLRDIREDTVDRQIARYLDRDDMVTTTMSTFASSTVHCARCHDHKFDPISQKDYYSLQAVFAGIERADRAYDPDPALHKKRTALLAKQKAIQERVPELLSAIREPPLRQEIEQWASAMREAVDQWQVIHPAAAVSASGSTLAVQPDGSVLASGVRPETDLYQVHASSPVPSISALCLQVLTDDSLPHGGPGRQDNGNLHLSEISIELVGSDFAQRVAATVRRAFADFDQENWTIQHAIDGLTNTAWGIHPNVGKPHYAVFHFAHPLSPSSDQKLEVNLSQLHGGGHLIGKFRLLAASGKSAVTALELPHSIQDTLRVLPSGWTDNQWIELGLFYLSQQTDDALAQLPPVQHVFAGTADFEPDGGHRPPGSPRTVHVLKRGEIHRPAEVAVPGAISILDHAPSRFGITDAQNEAARRAALADWLVHPENPLTWRSIVNRVWLAHFGSGIVSTPNDFGRMGSLPTHPELLDFLAAWFRANNGSFKQLHKLIVTSATYRQSSSHHPAFAHIDAENRLLWRMNRRRLDAESLRDTLLQVSGRLNLTMGGPSVRHFSLSPGIHVTPIVEYAQFEWENSDARRSIYRFLFRTLPDPFMETMDCPDGSQLAPVRSSTISPLQALALMNDPFVFHASQSLEHALAKTGGTLEAQISELCWRLYGRPPIEAERAALRSYASAHGMANLCRVLFNSNEFIFVE